MDIEEADMRVIVRLLGETASLPGGLMKKKLYLLDGLCNFVGSSEWAWALTSTNSAESLTMRRRIAESFDLPLVLEGASKPAVRWEPVNSAHVICSALAVNSHTNSMILLSREPGDPPYSRREIHLASLVLDEIPWLHWREWKPPRPSLAKLSPRLQWTLDLLLLGLGRKEISDQIGISEGTVSGYIRKLYHHFGVNSQAELMRIRSQEPSQQKPILYQLKPYHEIDTFRD